MCVAQSSIITLNQNPISRQINTQVKKSYILHSEATYHITVKSANLEEYMGNEKVSVGDYKTIPSAHTVLTQKKASNSKFMLYGTHNAPSVKENLMLLPNFNLTIEPLPKFFYSFFL